MSAEDDIDEDTFYNVLADWIFRYYSSQSEFEDQKLARNAS